MKFKIKLINIGREKVNQTYTQEASDLEEIANLVYAKVRGFLLSSEVMLEPDKDDKESWTVIVGGFRPVGNVIIQEQK